MSRIACLLVAVIMMVAMSTTTADAASFKAAPKGVKAKCVNGVSVEVTCKAKKGAKGYYFYYAKSKKGKYKLGAKSTKRTATIKGLTAGKTYYFKVKAYKGKKKKTFSKFSKPVKCKTVLKAPAFSASTECCCKINLKLTKPVGATGFLIYRSTNSILGFTQVGKTSSTIWQDTGLKEETKYFYKVKAYKGSYSSPMSSAKSAVTVESLGNGNGSEYSLDNCGTSDYKNELNNRNIFFLGSSITYGSQSGGVSFADYVAKRNGLDRFSCMTYTNGNWIRKTPEGGNGIVWKEAVSGTTMARIKGDLQTYSYRLYDNYQRPGTEINPDVFFCQLSLNDANKNIPLGTKEQIDFERLSDESRADAYLKELFKNSFTVAGAIEYITAYAYANWPDCQVIFYTISHFDGGKSIQYTKMVNLLNQEASINDIAVLNLWDDPAISAWKGNVFCLYMADSHHPKKAGYLQWTPYFEKALAKNMPDEQTYTITWKNEDGSVLEVDENCKRGDEMSYSGPEPEKSSSGDVSYRFTGWKNAGNNKVYSPDDIDKLIVLGDVTFIAQFEEIDSDEPGPDPGTELGNDPSEGNGSISDGNNSDGSNEDNDQSGGSDVNAGDGSNSKDTPTDGGNDDGSAGGSEGESDGGSDDGPDSILDMLGITSRIESFLRAA